MPFPDDFLTDLRARRVDLYEQLRLIDNRAVDGERSLFFGSVPGNEVTIRSSIERVEGQIADVDRQIAHFRNPTA